MSHLSIWMWQLQQQIIQYEQLEIGGKSIYFAQMNPRLYEYSHGQYLSGVLSSTSLVISRV